MSDMKLWDALKKPPASALKQIGGGRLKGMTDIKPQWRYMALTEQFGVCGYGWKYEIESTWTEEGSDNQVFAFAKVNLYIKDGEKWSDAIPGVGGSMLVAKESKGLYCNDEAFKMAVTDALSSSMKMIGVAAEIYMGNFDGTKYKDEPPPKPKHWADDKKTREGFYEFIEANKIDENDYMSALGCKDDIRETKFDKKTAKEMLKKLIPTGE